MAALPHLPLFQQNPVFSALSPCLLSPAAPLLPMKWKGVTCLVILPLPPSLALHSTFQSDQRTVLELIKAMYRNTVLELSQAL